jgi:dTDP-4-amino-4,6-dideoxygalactose transaminase
MINLSQPVIDERTEKRVLEVLRSGQLASGPLVAELERSFTDFTGTKAAIAVSSGTAALETVLESVVNPGDVVITTPFTFGATINAALRAGAEVRFVDIDENFNIDPDRIEEAVDDRTVVILPVHLYGRPCDMMTIEEVARRHGLLIIEDAAQAVGAAVAGRPVGSWGIGCFSLYATKNVAAGEGGIITTDDEALAATMRTFVNQGSSERYRYEMVGTNRRMTDLQAAVALPQMEDLAMLTERRRHNADRLTEGLNGLPGVITPSDTAGHVYHQYTIRITDNCPIDRDTFRARLAEGQIATGIYYPRLVHDYPCYAGNPRVVAGDTPRARRIVAEVVSLPVHPGLADHDVTRIIEASRVALHA